jgi:hypothetical protein
VAVPNPGLSHFEGESNRVLVIGQSRSADCLISGVKAQLQSNGRGGHVKSAEMKDENWWRRVNVDLFLGL